MTNQHETWRDVPGFDGLYKVSDHGRIRTVERVIIMKNGRPRTVRGRLRKAHPKDEYGHLNVRLSDIDGRVHNRTVHTVVAAAFFGPRPDGMHVRHLNGDPTDNRLENLAYGTARENSQDMVRHGRNNVSKTECPRGHPYVGSNVQRNATSGGRVCRSCNAAHSKIRRGNACREDFLPLSDSYFRKFTGVELPERNEAPVPPIRRNRGHAA